MKTVLLFLSLFVLSRATLFFRFMNHSRKPFRAESWGLGQRVFAACHTTTPGRGLMKLVISYLRVDPCRPGYLLVDGAHLSFLINSVNFGDACFLRITESSVPCIFLFILPRNISSLHANTAREGLTWYLSLVKVDTPLPHTCPVLCKFLINFIFILLLAEILFLNNLNLLLNPTKLAFQNIVIKACAFCPL